MTSHSSHPGGKPDIQHKIGHSGHNGNKHVIPCEISLAEPASQPSPKISTLANAHSKVPFVPASLHSYTSAALKTSQREVQRLQETIKSQYQQITELHSKLRDYEQNPCTHHDLKRYQAQHDSLHHRLEQVCLENTQLKQANQEVQGVLASLQKHVDSSFSLHQSVSKLQQDYRKCQALVSDKSKQISKLECQVNDKTKQISKLEGQVNDKSKQISKLECQVHDKSKQISKLEGQVSDKSKQFFQLQQKVQGFTSENTKQTQTIKDLQTKLATVTGEHSHIASSLQEEIKSLQASLQQATPLSPPLAIDPQDLQSALHIAEAQKTQLVEQSLAVEQAHDLLHLASKYILTLKGSDPSVAQELINCRDLLGSMLRKYD